MLGVRPHRKGGVAVRLLVSRVLYVGLGILASGEASATPIQWVGGNGHFYEMISTLVPTWHHAQSAAESEVLAGMPGHLVTLTSSAEEAFIRQSFGVQSLWLGLTDEESEGVFAWVTGEPFSYANWQPGEPNGGAFENYVEILTGPLCSLHNVLSQRA